MSTSAAERSDQPQAADVLVIFGITGDLAKVMTFYSLYRLEERGLLECPIVGVAVDDWTVDDLRERARTSIIDCGESIDDEVFARFADRLSYVAGDFADAGTYKAVAAEIKGTDTPVFYLEIPPFLFGMVIKGLAEAGLTSRRASSSRSRSAMTSPPRASLTTRSIVHPTRTSSSGSTTFSA